MVYCLRSAVEDLIFGFIRGDLTMFSSRIKRGNWSNATPAAWNSILPGCRVNGCHRPGWEGHLRKGTAKKRNEAGSRPGIGT